MLLKEITLKKRNYFCLWSGGHDSALTLYHATKKTDILCLITAMQDYSNQTKPNFFSPAVLRAQSDQLNIPLLIYNSDTENHLESFAKTLGRIKKHDLIGGFFPFINQPEQKNVLSELCQLEKIDAYFPLENREKEALLSEFIELGFKAKIIAVNERYLTRDLLNRDLDKETLNEIRSRKVDLFGENSEFQTILYEAPYFKQSLQIKEGDINLKNGYWVVDVSITSK